MNVYRDYGSSVMYDNGKILVMGGGFPDGHSRSDRSHCRFTCLAQRSFYGPCPSPT